MEGFLLDTCVLSETSKPKPDAGVLDFIDTAANLTIPIAALMEFQMGIMERCATDPIGAVRLSGWFTKLLNAGMPLAETNRDVAEVWGTLSSDKRLRNLITGDPRSKKPRNGQDIHIAAVAIVERLPIATFNVKDFQLINECYPLPGIYNPREEKWYSKMAPLAFSKLTVN